MSPYLYLSISKLRIKQHFWGSFNCTAPGVHLNFSIKLHFFIIENGLISPNKLKLKGNVNVYMYVCVYICTHHTQTYTHTHATASWSIHSFSTNSIIGRTKSGGETFIAFEPITVTRRGDDGVCSKLNSATFGRVTFHQRRGCNFPLIQLSGPGPVLSPPQTCFPPHQIWSVRNHIHRQPPVPTNHSNPGGKLFD